MPSEFDLIARHFARATPQTTLGPGDDCALMTPTPGMTLCATTDMLVSGTHFLPDTDPAALGWKTLAVNLSDLAAMGAAPRWVLLAGALPQADEDWLAAFADGFFACAGRFGVDVVGGDTTRGPLNLCVTALGEVPPGKALQRDRARVGDDLWVSGEIGLAALGLAHRLGRTVLPDPLTPHCLDRLDRPTPRIALGLALREGALAGAAIDISDGLVADVGHLAERSQCSVDIDLAALPPPPAGVDETAARNAQLTGGDDYELAFSAAPEHREALAALAGRLDLALHRIGRFVDADPSTGSPAVRVLDPDGRPRSMTMKGYDHFA